MLIQSHLFSFGQIGKFNGLFIFNEVQTQKNKYKAHNRTSLNMFGKRPMPARSQGWSKSKNGSGSWLCASSGHVHACTCSNPKSYLPRKKKPIFILQSDPLKQKIICRPLSRLFFHFLPTLSHVWTLLIMQWILNVWSYRRDKITY